MVFEDGRATRQKRSEPLTLQELPSQSGTLYVDLYLYATVILSSLDMAFEEVT